MRARRLVIALVLLAFIGSTSGCYGPFNATRRLHHWNGEMGGPWTNELAFLGLMLVPAYALFSLGDVLLFNSVEFWTGSNWIDPPEGDPGATARRSSQDPYGGQDLYSGQDPYSGRSASRGQDPTGRNEYRGQDPDLLNEDGLYTDTDQYDDSEREYRDRNANQRSQYRNMSTQRISAPPRAFSEGDLILKLYRDLVPNGRRMTVELYDQGVLRENFTLVVEADGTVIKRDNNGNVLVYAQIRPDRSIWINDIEHNTSKLYSSEDVQSRVRRGTRRI